MSEHPNKVVGKAAQELAELLVNTTYGYQEDFFGHLSYLYRRESEADKARGYVILSALLKNVSLLTSYMAGTMVDIWDICKDKNKKDTT